MAAMNTEPRQREDYSDRQVEAAHRVLVDLGQVLASFADCLVVVGGWTPDLPIPEADEPHVGSIEILREKFATVDSLGPQQLVEFHSDQDEETQAMQARRAFELVKKFLQPL